MTRKELELEEKVNLVDKEVNLLGDDVEKVRLDVEEAIDHLKLEIRTIKIMLKEIVPDFDEKFGKIRNSVIQEIEPE